MKVSIGDRATPIKKEENTLIKSDKNDIVMPNNIIVKQMSLKIEVELVKLFIRDEIIYHSLDIDKITKDLDTYLVPMINKILLDMLDNNINNKTAICEDLINIIFRYVKLEYIMHSLVLKEDFIQDYISNMVFAIVFVKD